MTSASDEARAAKARAEVRARIAAARAAGCSVVAGHNVLEPTHPKKEPAMLDTRTAAAMREQRHTGASPGATPPPPAPAVTLDPDRAGAALDGAARAVGLEDASSIEALIAQIRACATAVGAATPAAIEATALRAGLSPREAKMLSEQRGATTALVAKYAALKKQTRRAR